MSAVAGKTTADVYEAEAALGANHPLVGALDDVRVAIDQLLVTGAVSTASAWALAANASLALSLVIAGAVVELGLACRLIVLLDRTREEARDLIAAGGYELALAVVQAERCRLLDPRHRAHLARWTDGLTRSGDGWPARPIGSASTLRTVAPELHKIAALLRTDMAGIQGVALMERLLTRGYSPLYGDEMGALREELRRVHYYLRTSGQ